jgi:spermidine synthase
MNQPVPPRSSEDRVFFRGIFLVALATLLFEVSLIRVLSFTIWYHFVYAVISSALLGFGASGTLLAIRPQIGAHAPRATLTALALAAGASATAALAMVVLLPLHPSQVLEQPTQLATFAAYLLAAMLPFFFSGLAVSICLRACHQRVDRLYFWDLLGAGLGCAAAVPLMNFLSPPGAILVAASSFAVGAFTFSTSGWMQRSAAAAAVALAIGSPFAADLPFTPAKSKFLSIRIDTMGMVPVATRWTALFRTDLLGRGDREGPLSRNDAWGWGLSLTAPKDIQEPCCFIEHDGAAGTAMYDLREGWVNTLDHHVLSMPYLAARPDPRVMVIGVGGGQDILAAVRYGASHVTGLELDPATVELLCAHPTSATNALCVHPAVEIVVGEGRSFVRRTQQDFDLIQITAVDTLAAQFSGSFVLAENYLYTVEAFHDYLDVLGDDGIVSVATSLLRVGQGDYVGRMVSVAQRSLRERGVTSPEDHIAVIHSKKMLAIVLIGKSPLPAATSQKLTNRAKQLQFTPLHIPGIEKSSPFTELATLTGSERERFLAKQTLQLHAVTDDQPFFFKRRRWGDAFQGAAHRTGEVMLILILVVLTVLGSVIILAPLLFFRGRGISVSRRRYSGILVYFLALGMGFMLFEVSLIQRFVLYLGYPTYSLSVTLFSLLVFLGCGSFLSRRWVDREQQVLPLAVGAVALMALFYIMGLPVVQDATLESALAVRVTLTAAMLAPLGLVLGIFFPLGIHRAAAIHEDLVPWAWAINGCGSVTATILAVVLAMTVGFTNVWIISLTIYASGVAALLWGERAAD